MKLLLATAGSYSKPAFSKVFSNNNKTNFSFMYDCGSKDETSSC